MADALRTRFISGTSPRLSVTEIGKGPLVIFLHGIGGNARNWELQQRELAGDFLAVALDMRGYGCSDDYSGDMHIEDVCADISKVIENYDAGSAHLVGLSMGGMVAQEFYRSSPGKVSTLTLANTNAGIGVDFSQQEKDDFIRLRKNRFAERGEPVDILPGMLEVLLGKGPSDYARENIAESILALRYESYAKALSLIINLDSSDITGCIDVPVLLIGSTLDRVIPFQSLVAMHRKIPNSWIHILDDVGHLSNLERPELFNALVKDFLLCNDTRDPPAA